MEDNKQISLFEIDNVKSLLFCGDIHGEFAELVCKMERYGIQDSVIVVLGDCGIGFQKPGYYPHIYKKKLEKKLDKYNNIILCIRGNHDDPRYYDNPEYILNLPRLRTLPSNTLLKVMGYNILCIGGAISIDRDERIEYNDTKLKPNHPKCYWDNEGPIILDDILDIDCKVDIVLSHTSPISFDPPLFRGENSGVKEEILWEDILNTRNYLELINSRLKPKRWYYGHFHKSYSGSTGCTIWRCLDIMEIIEVPEKEPEVLGILPEEEKDKKKKKSS